MSEVLIKRKIPLGKREFVLYYPESMKDLVKIYKLGPDAFSVVIKGRRGFVICRKKRYIHCETSMFSTYLDSKHIGRRQIIRLPNNSFGKIKKDSKGRYLIYLFTHNTINGNHRTQ